MEDRFNRFDDIEDANLRAYNRTVFLHNLRQDEGEVAARQYILLFNEEERQEMYVMTTAIGIKAKQEVQNGL